MNPVRSSLHFPQVTLVITAMLFAVGVYSLATMPRREDPKITIRTGIVAAFYPGATAEEVENQVARKIEERLFRFAEVRKERTYSTSRNGMVYINVELEDYVRNTDEFWSKLRLDLAQLRATSLPEGVIGPVVDSDFGDTVAVLIAVHGRQYSYAQLKQYAERIETALRTIRSVSKIRRYGEQQEQIEITSSTERLAQYAVNPIKIIQALQGRNTVQYAGKVPASGADVPIKPSGPFQAEQQIRSVMIDVSPATGQPVHIGDLADVRRVYKDPTQYARLNGERTILLAVEMQEGNNIVQFGDTLRATIDGLRPLLPPDLKLDLVADQPRVVSERIRHFIREFGIAITAVILVTMVLLPLRVAVISAIAIPVTVSITFGFLNAFGIELHQVSISALIVVLGMVVDDAIVIADNYVELLDRRVPAAEAAWRSATELAVPVLTATLTIIGSFLPMLLLSGAVGEFIRALPITVAIALGSSFVVAMLLTPLLARFFIKRGLHSPVERGRKKRFSPLDYMQRAYNVTIVRAMAHRPAVVVAAVGAVGLGMVLLRFVPQQFFPAAERNQFVIDVWLPAGTKIETTDAVVRRIEQHLKQKPLVEELASFLGASAPRFYYNVNPQHPASNYAQVLVNTRSAEETPALVHELRRELRRAAPEARVYVKELQQGNVMEAPVEVRVSGSDISELRATGGKVENILRDTPGAVYVHDDWLGDSYDLRVNVKEEVANRLGLTNASIARQLAGGFEGAGVTTFWEGDHDIRVVLRLDPSRRETFEDVADTYVMSPLTGARVPVGSVATLSPSWEPSRIVRRNGVRTFTARAFPGEHRLASEIVQASAGRIDDVPLPAGYRIEYGGEVERQRETFRELLHALGISIIAIYLILLFQFRSISEPLIVMASIPLALPGAVFGLLITRNPFGFTAFLGIVSLGGIVVRNAIILIEYIRDRMKEGVAVEQAALEAGERRLRPIFLTTMAAAVGVTPMILSGSSLWSPLASAIAFGLLVSMFFTLIAIPVLYVLLHRRPRVPASAVAAIIAALFACGRLGAEPVRITLDEAVARAAAQSSPAKLANLKIRETDAKRMAARANYFPQLTNQTNGVDSLRRHVLDIPRGALGLYPNVGPIPFADIPIPLGNRAFLLSTTTLAQPITQLFKIRAGVDAARSDVETARAEARRAENEIALKTKQLFYGLLIAGKRRAAVQSQIEAGEQRLREARDAVEAESILELRVLEGRARLAEARQALQTIDDTIADLAVEFNNLVGLPLDADPEPVPPSSESWDPAAQGLAAEALRTNPEVQAAQHTIEKARAGLRAARAEYIPDLGAFAQHIYQTGVPLLSRNNAAIGLRLDVTVLDFGKRRAAVREREAQLAEAEENLKRVSDRVRIDIEKGVRKVRRSGTSVDAAKEAVEARTEARRVTGDQVQAGVATTAALREADGALAAAAADLYQAELNRSIAIAELQNTAGRR